MTEYTPVSLRSKLSKVLKLDPTIHSNEQLKVLEEVFVSGHGYKLQDYQEVMVDIVRLSFSKDVRLKKLVYIYLTLAVKCNPDIFLHATNSASNDLSDPNPIIRSSTLRSITELPLILDVTLEYICQAILVGLKDSNANVRCNAISGVIQVFSKKRRLSSDYFTAMLDKVKAMIQSESDPSVVVKCLECLSLCYKKDDIIQQLITSLIERIAMLDSYLAITVLHRANISLEHEKLSEDKVFSMLNAVETIKGSCTSYSIILETLSLMLKVSSLVENIQKDVLLQIISSLISLFTVSNKDVAYLVLCNLLALDHFSDVVKERLIKDIDCFLVLYDDSSHVIVKKIEILCFCTTQQTAERIYHNIKPYLHKNQLKNVVEIAFYALEILYKFLPTICVDALFCLLHSKSTTVAECCVVSLYHITVMHNLQANSSAISTKMLNALLNSFTVLQSIKSKLCFFWLMTFTEDKSQVRATAKLLNADVLRVGDVSLDFANYQQSIFTVIFKFFVKWPCVFKCHVKKVISQALSLQEYSFLQEQAKLYYVLLNKDVSLLKVLLDSSAHFKFVIQDKKVNRSQNFNTIKLVSLSYS